MRNNKLIIKSDVDFKIRESVENDIAVKVKEIVEEMSHKFMRNIEVTVKIDVE